MNRRKRGSFALCASADAHQAGKIHRIGVLFFGSRNQPHLESFLQGLRDLEYVESKNAAFEYRYADGKFDRLRELAADLVSLKVDVVVTTTTGSAQVRQSHGTWLMTHDQYYRIGG